MPDTPDALARDLGAALTAHGLWQAGMAVLVGDRRERARVLAACGGEVVLAYDGSPIAIGRDLVVRCIPDLSSWATVGVLLGLLAALGRDSPEALTKERDTVSTGGKGDT